MGFIVPNVSDELDNALPEVIPHRGSGTYDRHHQRRTSYGVWIEWRSLSAMDVAEKLVMRGANRAFVGLPMCNTHPWHCDWYN